MYELPAYAEPCAAPGNQTLNCGYGFRVVICGKESIDDMSGWIAKYSEAREVVEGDFQPVNPFMHRSVKKHRLFQSTPLLLIPNLPMIAYHHIPASIMPQTYEWAKQKHLRLGTECITLLVEYCTKMAATESGFISLKLFLRAGDYRLSPVHLQLISMVNNILFQEVRNIDVKAFIGTRVLTTYVHAFVMWYVNDFKRSAATALKKQEEDPDVEQLTELLNRIAVTSMRQALSRWPLDDGPRVKPVHSMHYYQNKTIKDRPVPTFQISVRSVLKGNREYETYQEHEALDVHPYPLIAFVQAGLIPLVFQDRSRMFDYDEEAGILTFEHQLDQGEITKYVYSLEQKSMMGNNESIGDFLYVTEGTYHMFIKMI